MNAWSFGIERQITKNSAFEARYAGNRAYDLFQSVNGNPFIADLQAAFPNLVPAGLTPCPTTQQVGPGAGTDVGRVNCGQGVTLTRNNGGYSYYNGVQLEFRANNLFNQLTVRGGYTFSKTLDNVSEIFGTLGGGNTSPFAQNPLNPSRGEYSFSGLDVPHVGTVIFSEQLPFFKQQHGFIGHVLGGWALSGSYILASGQRYTPVQAFGALATASGNFYDAAFIGNFWGFDIARPFLGNLSAPSTATGIFAGDACSLFGAGCATLPTQLISFTSLGQSCLSLTATASTPCNVVNVTNNDVRFILNAGTAQSVFGTPFGNTPRNPVQDAMTNIANFAILKNLKLSERTSFEFRATMLNVFNHPNFSSVDPFLEDSGLQGFFTGFGDPSLTNSVTNGNVAGTRQILFGGTFRF